MIESPQSLSRHSLTGLDRADKWSPVHIAALCMSASLKNEVQKLRPIKHDDGVLKHHKHVLYAKKFNMHQRINIQPQHEHPISKIIRGWESALVVLKEALLCDIRQWPSYAQSPSPSSSRLPNVGTSLRLRFWQEIQSVETFISPGAYSKSEHHILHELYFLNSIRCICDQLLEHSTLWYCIFSLCSKHRQHKAVI